MTTTSELKPLTGEQKIKNAETMYGTNSPQHLKALRLWGSK